MLPVKSSSDDNPGFRHGFGAEASLPLTQGTPAVSHNTTRLYWMMFDLYECHIRSDAITVLFWIFFIFSLFFAGKSPILVKNVAVAFEIKPWHPISRGNMSVDQPFLIHCSRNSSYFSKFCWCAQSRLGLKGIVIYTYIHTHTRTHTHTHTHIYIYILSTYDFIDNIFKWAWDHFFAYS